jgi:hypothetical protein
VLEMYYTALLFSSGDEFSTKEGEKKNYEQ